MAYRELFETSIDAEDISAIRLRINKDCVLGGERFQTETAGILGRLGPIGRPCEKEGMPA